MDIFADDTYFEDMILQNACMNGHSNDVATFVVQRTLLNASWSSIDIEKRDRLFIDFFLS